MDNKEDDRFIIENGNNNKNEDNCTIEVPNYDRIENSHGLVSNFINSSETNYDNKSIYIKSKCKKSFLNLKK